MVAGQRVTDELLTEWAAGRPVNLYDWPSIVRVLVAELRESRVQETKMRGQRDDYWQKLLTVAQDLRVAEAEREDHRRNWHAEMARVGQLQDAVEHQRGMYEREHNTVHELQKRIDNALVELDGASYQMGSRVRAALTGAEVADRG